jgi:hypothetical protein
MSECREKKPGGCRALVALSGEYAGPVVSSLMNTLKQADKLRLNGERGVSGSHRTQMGSHPESPPTEAVYVCGDLLIVSVEIELASRAGMAQLHQASMV